MSRTQFQHLIRLVFGLGLLGCIVHQIEFSQLIALARAGRPLYLALGAGLLVIGMLGLQWTRLHVLIRSYTRSWRISLEIFYVGALFNNFLPSNLGGDAMRLMYLRNLGADNLGTPFALLLAYRASSFVVLLAGGLAYVLVEHARLFALLGVGRFAVNLDGSKLGYALALLGVGLVAAAWLGRYASMRMQQRVLDFWRGCRDALTLLRPRVVASLMAQTLLFHLCRLLSFYFLVGYAGQHIVLWDLVFVLWISALANMLPVSVAGFGVVEATITGLLALYGVDITCAGAVALVNRAVMLLAAAIGAVIYMRGAVAQPRSNAIALKPAAKFNT
jgi:uncharacterized membrane protein YbhN (UPF0104 family)